jgi:hypothetical protein
MRHCIGVVDVDYEKPVLREIRGRIHYLEEVKGISEDNIYILRRDEDGFFLVKKPKNSDSYIKVKSALITWFSFVTNDETGFVAPYGPLPEMGSELSPKIYVYVPIYPDAAATAPHEYLITFPKDSVFRLTSVLSPNGDYVVVEERYLSLWETPRRNSQRFLALNLKTRELSLLYERPHVWNSRDEPLGAIKWISIPGSPDSARSSKVVNN